MANPLQFEQFRTKLKKANTVEEMEQIIASLKQNFELETPTKIILLEYARELRKSLLNCEIEIQGVTKNLVKSTELSKVIGMIKKAVSPDDIAAARTIVADANLADKVKLQLMAILKKKRTLN